MTKEELEKEAEEYAKENYCEEVRATARNAYLDCARLREKRIAELEAQIEKMKSCINCRYCINEKCPWQPKGCGMKHWELRR